MAISRLVIPVDTVIKVNMKKAFKMLNKFASIGLISIVSFSNISSGIVKAEETQCSNAQNAIIIEILNKTTYKYPDLVGENFNPLSISKKEDGSLVWAFDMSGLSDRTNNIAYSPKLMSSWAQTIGKGCKNVNTVLFGVVGGNWQTWFNRKENFTYPHTRFDDHTNEQH